MLSAPLTKVLHCPLPLPLTQKAGGLVDVLLAAWENATYETQLQVSGEGTATQTHSSDIYQGPNIDGNYDLYDEDETLTRDGRVVDVVGLHNNTFTNAHWTNYGEGITSGVADPYGGTDAFTVTAALANARIRARLDATPGVVSTDAVIVSVWLRRRTGTGSINFYLPDGSANLIQASITSTWKRFAVDAEGGLATSIFDLRIYAQNDQLDIAFSLIEKATGRVDKTNPSEYTKTTTAAVQKVFSTTNGNTVASSIVTEAAGVALVPPPSVVNQGAGTNSQIRSNDLANAEYTATNVTVGDQDVDGIAAGKPGCTLTATAANGAVIANAVVKASATHATKWYIKRKTGTGVINLSVDGGTTWQAVTVTADYTPLAVDQAAVTNPQIGIRIVTSGDAIYVGNAESHLDTVADGALLNIGPIFTATTELATDAAQGVFSNLNLNDSALGFYLETDYLGIDQDIIVDFLKTLGGNFVLTDEAANTVSRAVAAGVNKVGGYVLASSSTMKIYTNGTFSAAGTYGGAIQTNATTDTVPDGAFRKFKTWKGGTAAQFEAKIVEAAA